MNHKNLIDHETFPTEEIERLNIYAGNYFPSMNSSYGNEESVPGGNEYQQQQLYYHRAYESQQQYQYQQGGWYSDYSNHSPFHRNKQQHYPHHHHSSHHHHLNYPSHQPLDLSNAETLKSNLLQLLSDGRIILLSRIPILYRTKFGREFREDIEGEGKIKLIDVFQAFGSPFVLIGEGGNASVRREIPYDELISISTSSTTTTSSNPNAMTGSSSHHFYNGNGGGSSSSSSHPAPPLTVYEAEIRLRNNLDLLLEDGKEIYFADLPTLYKTRFGIDYREGVELRGRMKLRRLFQHYGYPFVIQGDGLETTVRKIIPTSHPSSSLQAWPLYPNQNQSNVINATKTNQEFLPSDQQRQQHSSSFLNSETHFPPLVSPLTCHYSRTSSSQFGSNPRLPLSPPPLSDNLTNEKEQEDKTSSDDLLSQLDYLSSSHFSIERNFENLPNPSLAHSHLQLSTSSTISSSSYYHHPLSELSLKHNSSSCSEYPTNQPLLTPNLSSQSYTTTSSGITATSRGRGRSRSIPSSSIIIDHSKWDQLLDLGYLGILMEPSALPHHQHHQQQQIFFNSTNPFCVVSIGQPGSGRSHTLSVLLENCLFPSSRSILPHMTQGSQETGSATGGGGEVCTLLLHSNPQKILSDISKIFSFHSSSLAPPPPPPAAAQAHGMLPIISRHGTSPRRIIILVSPTYFLQQKRIYQQLDPEYLVLPLIFRWSSLKMNQIKILMRLFDDYSLHQHYNTTHTNSHQHHTDPATSQQQYTYSSYLLDIFKEYQSLNKQLSYEEYAHHLLQQNNNSKEDQENDKSWKEFIQKRLNFMKYFIDEFYLLSPSHYHQHHQQQQEGSSSSPYSPLNFQEIFQSGHLVLCDFTDPILTSDECTTLHHLLLMIYRTTEPPHSSLPSQQTFPPPHPPALQKLFVMENLYQHLHRVMAPPPPHSTPSASSSTTISPSSDPTHLLPPTTSYLSRSEFASEVLDLVRHFNDEKMKVILTAQSPLDVPPDVLEFSTMTIVHQCQAQDGLAYLLKKLPLQVENFDDIRSLEVGQALLVTCRGNIDQSYGTNPATGRGEGEGEPLGDPLLDPQQGKGKDLLSSSLLNSIPTGGAGAGGSASVAPRRKQYVYPVLIRERMQNM